ncbi:Rossmann-like and DUF2520 domain-containing protein [Burkholderia cepacia]|uniref:Rossmann-like and DUF2520 domain-containing protein n=1 Tax=Burkholderia cepacia TaxID=292 RepID=UPI001F1A6FA7|nr:Rossmann-like and DUF2520 domain-containing protein [Burkholderia cepacia]MCE4124407.1 DUF2520 domain-containing protein [Burkholderia cepacia]
MATLNIIGSGRVGRTLGNLIVANHVLEIGDLYDMDAERACEAVEFIGAGRPIDRVSAMRPADVWLLSVPDTHISKVADQLARERPDRETSNAVHCSGTLDADVLAPLRANGWAVASAHPMLSFAHPPTAVFQFEGTPCGLEGDHSARVIWSDTLAAVGGRCFEIRPGSKTLYHAATAVASNFLPVLAAISAELWEASGTPDWLIPDMMRTLTRNCADSIVALGPREALTGPAACGDHAEVNAQSNAIANWDPVSRAAYDALSILAFRLAQTGKIRTD